jgi:hypothetical protein
MRGRGRAAAAWLVAIVLLAPFAARAAEPADFVLYHAAADDGVRPAFPDTLPPGPATLHLYMDAASGNASPSAQGTACSAGLGDERCGFDLVVEATAGATLGGFSPAGGVTWSLTGTRLHAVGGDFVAGELGIVKLGDLDLTVTGNGQVEVGGEIVVDARLVGRPVPMRVVSFVPEPDGLAMLGWGLAVLVALALHRTRDDRGRRNACVPAAVLALALAAGTAGVARAQWLPSVDVDTIRINGSTLYFNNKCGTEFTPPISRVRKLATSTPPTPTPTPTDVYDPATCEGDRVASKNVAVHGGDVYWLSGVGEVVVQPYDGSGPNVVSTMATVPGNGVESIAEDGTWVYWSEGTTLYRALLAGSSRSFVTSYASNIDGIEALGGQDLVILAGGLLQRLFWSSTFGWLSTTYGPATAFAIYGNDVFWADPSGPGGDVLIRAQIDGGPTTTLTTLSGAGGPVVSAMAANWHSVFYQPVVLGSGPIARVNQNGTGAGNIVPSVGGLLPGQLGADRDHAFWVQSFTAIDRIDEDAAIVAENLEVLAMEVVQIGQRPTNDVRLVADKATHVRLWGRIESSSIGTTSTRPWPMAEIRGFRGGLELPESPLSPSLPGVAPLGTNPVPNRNSTTGQLLFRLPESWTQAGDLELHGILNPAGVFAETDPVTDNEIVETVTFEAKAAICARVINVETVAGSYGSYRARDAATYFRAETLLPTPDLRLYFPGGDPWQEWEHPLGLGRGAFELSRTDNDSWQLIARMVASEPFWGTPGECQAVGAKQHLLAIAPPTLPNPAANGLAAGNSTILWMRYGRDSSNSPQNSDVAGVSLAHELGHNDGRAHVDCAPGDPDGPDSAYPYTDPCTIDDDPVTGYTGLDPISLLPLAAASTSDLMGYGHRRSPPRARWPSAYTWDGIFDDIATPPGGGGSGSALDPLGGGGASHGPVPMQVIGLIDPDRPVATLTPSLPLDAVDVVNRFVQLYVSAPVDPNLVLRVRDASGALIEENGLIVMTEAEAGLERGSLFVSFVTGEGAPPARLEVVDLSAPGVPWGVLESGPAAPVVTIDTPLGGEVETGTLDVAWTASDADGDTLYFNVRYSADLGASWQPILWQSEKTAISPSTLGLPSCAATCLVEVTATDGMHATTVVSPPFTTTPDPLTPSIFLRRPGASGVTTHLVVPQSSEATLHGFAYSDEDGPLTGGALQWSLAGPDPQAGAGETLAVEQLRPGPYAVTLTATDSLSQVGVAQATLIVEPKRVPGANAPVLDGDCSEPLYQADDDPARIPYFGPESAYAHMVHAGSTTYVCLSGLVPSAIGPGEAGIALDLDESGGVVPQIGDLELRVDRDGVVTYGVGDGSSDFQPAPVPAGFDARVDVGATTWSAELAIDDTLLGGFTGRVSGQLFHRYPGLLGLPVQVSWPRTSFMETPDGWGAIALGTPIRVEIDADGAHDPNHIDPNAVGVAHTVVVWSSDALDAVNDVDYATATFGPGGATAFTSSAQDVNGDQLADMVLAYWTEDVGAGPADVELCLDGQLVQALGSEAFRACDDVVPTCAPDTCDFDADGIADESDGCPLLADDGTDSGGLLSQQPDGIPDACQCGDWLPDGMLDGGDVARMRAWLAEQPVAPVAFSTCDVDADGACDVVDLAVMVRAQAGSPGAVLRQACDAMEGP